MQLNDHSGEIAINCMYLQLLLRAITIKTLHFLNSHKDKNSFFSFFETILNVEKLVMAGIL